MHHALSDERTEFLIRGPSLSFMRFLGLGLADAVPGRQHDLDVPRGAEEGRRHLWPLFRQRFDEALRSEGFLAMSGQIVDAAIMLVAQTAQHDRREESDQGRPDSRGLEGQACEARAEGSGRALDGQILQGKAARGWKCAGGRPRDPGVRLQEPRLDRSGLRPDPQLDDDARRGARRGAARRRSGPDEHGERRLGGHGLPLGEERAMLARHEFVSRLHRKKPPEPANA